MRQSPKRRIRKCYLCPATVRESKMHKMYYSGPDNDMRSEIAPAPQTQEKQVLICDLCFVGCGYHLKRLEKDKVGKA